MVAIGQSEPLSGHAGIGIRVKLLGAFDAMALLGIATCLVALMRGETLLAIIATISLLAHGNLNVVVPELGNDEVGEMAGALAVFRDRARLSREREANAAPRAFGSTLGERLLKH
jgi:hypothetical protein